MNVVLFDICGTIYQSNTTFDFLEYTFSNRQSFKLYKGIYHTYLWKVLNKTLRQLFTYDLTRVIALKFLKGYKRDELIEKVEEYYDSFLKPRKNVAITNVIQKINEDRETRIILLSATIDVVAEVIASRLGLQEYYSTILEYQNGKCTGTIKKDLLGKKLTLVKNLDIESLISSFYTDDFSDVPVLDIAKEKNIVVYPKYKKRWEKIIELRKWEVNYIEV